MPDEKSEEKLPKGLDLPCLTELAGNLTMAMKNAEPDFLKLGASLNTIFGDADALVKSVAAAAMQIGDNGEGGLNRKIADVTGRSLEVFQAYKGTIEGHLSGLAQSSSQMNRLLNVCEQIGRNTSFLNIVGLNLGIESGRSTEAATLFQGGGKKTQELSRSMGEMLGRIHDRALLVREDQIRAHGEISHSMKEFATLSDSAERAVENAARRIVPLMEHSLTTLEKAEQGSRDIFSQAGEIVMSIQFHDIARQQVEHIAEGLMDAEGLMEPAMDQEGPEPEKMARAHWIVSLQASQLDNVIVEIQSAYDNFLTSFGSIGDGIEELGETLDPPKGEGSRQAGMSGQMEALKEGLGSLQEIVSQQEAMEERIRETMERSSQAASVLAGFAGQVSE